MNRRHFLATVPAMAALSAWSANWPIGCNQYAWGTFYRREKKDWDADLDASLAAFASSGLTAYEPSITRPEQISRLIPLLQKHRLTMPSLYVNTLLHKEQEAKQSVDDVLAIAREARKAGARIVITNPSPIKWGGPENKSDAELMTQARYLDDLGARLRSEGMTLAYHTHDVELRAAGREFHHMMLATDPAHVHLCLDAHWVYRGSGNSQVALFDIVELYGRRIAAVHLRQSVGGTWSETFQVEGDIDYKRLSDRFRDLKIHPYLVLEQCLEAASPNTLNAVAAHREDLRNVRNLFRS